MQLEKKLELADRAATLWSRLMPSCPVPEQRYLIQWRAQGKYALLTSITKTAEKWDRNEFESPLAAWCYCASTCRNIAMENTRQSLRRKAANRG